MSTIGDRRVDISSLTTPTREKIKKATSADEVKQILAADGKIDAKEKAVLEEVEAELGQNPEDGNQALTFQDGKAEANTVIFGKGILKESVRAAAVQRLGKQSTEGRADILRGASSTEDVQAFLAADQQLAGTQTDGTKTKYGTSGSGAAKVLLQDAVMLEKFGVLTATQKQQLGDIMGKLGTVKGYAGGDGKTHYMEQGTGAITKEDITTLDGIVEDAMKRLDGAELPKMDYGKLNTLSSSDNTDQNLQTIADNLDPMHAEFDAAIHDLELSYSEIGGAAGGKVGENGRIFGRIEDAVNEVDQQLTMLKSEVLPSLEQQLEANDKALYDAIYAKAPELQGKGKEEVSNAVTLNPALADDPNITALREKKQGLLTMYSQLSDRAGQLSDAKIKGLTRLSSLQTIVREEKVRTSAVNEMGQKLGQATGDLQQLQNQLEEIGKHAPAGKHPEKLSDYMEIAKNIANQPYADLKSAEAIKTKLGDIRNNMITGMKGLIQTYETSGTANATATQLLKKELATLEALKTDNPDQAIEVLEEVRQHLIGELGKQVGPLISKNEYMALTGLDKKVTSYAQADRFTTGAADAKIASIQDQIEEAKGEKKETIERTLEAFDKFADDKLAYGTHAQVSLSLSVGLGLGTEEFGAYAGVGVEGTARIGKDFGMGPTYTATLDLDFIAEATASIPFLGKFEAKYATTLLSTGIGFNTMEESREFVKDVSKQLDLGMKVGVLEDALANAKNPGLFSSVDPEKVAKLERMLRENQQELTAVEARVDKAIADHKVRNDKSSFEGSIDIEAFHGQGKMKVETNVQTYMADGEEHKVEDKTKFFQATVNHYGLKVGIQNSKDLSTGENKDRYSFSLVIPPDKVGALLKKGASLSSSIGKATLEKMAEQVVATIGKIDPSAGLTSAFVVAMMEKQWAQATVSQAKDLGAVGHAAKGGSHGHSGFHQEFLVGMDFVFENDKFQYAAVEAAYEASFEKAKRVSIPAGPIPLQARGKISMQAEVGVVIHKFKSNDYKAKHFEHIMHELKPGMKNASGAQLLQQFATEPALANDKKMFDYTHGVLKDMREKFPELKGLDDTQTLAKALENPDLYLAGTFFADVMKKTGGGH
jgi:hypothetical protein